MATVAQDDGPGVVGRLAAARRSRHRRRGAVSLGLVVLLVAAVGLGLGAGALPVPPALVVQALLAKLGLIDASALDPVSVVVVQELRLPRVVVGMLVGAVLALAGAVMQGLFRNPLAEPGLAAVDPGVMAPALFAMLLAGALLPRFALLLDALALGEREALQLGFDVEAAKRWLVLLVALGVGAAVATCGIIGFVGLVVPHLIRQLVGTAHAWLLPLSAVAGAALLLLADVAARLVVIPAELPIGILTAALGGPFFLALLLAQRRRFAL